MNKITGKVIEIYIPKQYKNDNLLDIMDRTNITFKVMTDNGIKEIDVEQNQENSSIMKNDLVEIVEQTISDKKFVDIRLYGGEDYE